MIMWWCDAKNVRVISSVIWHCKTNEQALQRYRQSAEAANVPPNQGEFPQSSWNRQWGVISTSAAGLSPSPKLLIQRPFESCLKTYTSRACPELI